MSSEERRRRLAKILETMIDAFCSLTEIGVSFEAEEPDLYEALLNIAEDIDRTKQLVEDLLRKTLH